MVGGFFSWCWLIPHRRELERVINIRLLPSQDWSWCDVAHLNQHNSLHISPTDLFPFIITLTSRRATTVRSFYSSCTVETRSLMNAARHCHHPRVGGLQRGRQQRAATGQTRVRVTGTLLAHRCPHLRQLADSLASKAN